MPSVDHVHSDNNWVIDYLYIVYFSKDENQTQQEKHQFKFVATVASTLDP